MNQLKHETIKQQTQYTKINTHEQPDTTTQTQKKHEQQIKH